MSLSCLTWAADYRTSSYGSGSPGFSLSVGPDGEFIMLNGTDTNNINHVLHSSPIVGVQAEMAFQNFFGNWTPKFYFSNQTIRFAGANNESVQYAYDTYNTYSLGLENQLLDGLVASGMVAYSEQMYLYVDRSSNLLTIDRTMTPTATVALLAKAIDYQGYQLLITVKGIGYFPVSTDYYKSSFGYGIEPSVSTVHYFTDHITVTGKAYYLKRTQNTTAFNLVEQDFGVSLMFGLVF